MQITIRVKELPTKVVNVFGEGEMVDTEKVKQRLTEAGIKVYSPLLAGILAICYEKGLHHVADLLVADEPDEETLRVLKQLQAEYPRIEIVDGKRRMTLRVNALDVEKVCEVLEGVII